MKALTVTVRKDLLANLEIRDSTTRPGVVDLFYKGYINTKEHYAKIKGKKGDLRPDAINTMYGLENNEVGHVIFKNPKDRDLQEALEKVS